MNRLRMGLFLLAAIVVAYGAVPLARADRFYDQEDLSLFLDTAAADAMAAEGQPGEAAAAGEAEAAKPGKPPPLPLHTIEGTGGGLITNMAYLINPGPEGTKIAPPAFSYSFLKAGRKTISSYVVSMTFLRRIEFSYAANRVGLGLFPDDVRQATAGPEVPGISIGRDHVWLHNFNLRGMVITETANVPAVTAGVHFKKNSGIRSIDHRLGNALSFRGFERESGVDFTIAASKTFPKLLCNRPVLTTVGVRFTQGAQIGWLGFGNDWATNIEASVAWVPTDWLAVGYEYRQKTNPYRRIALVTDEDDWHTILVAWIINPHMSLAGAWAHLGNVANGVEDAAWGLQFKYEF